LSRHPDSAAAREAGGGRAANGSPAKGAAGLRPRSTWLVAGLELGDPGRAALNFAARPPPAPHASVIKSRERIMIIGKRCRSLFAGVSEHRSSLVARRHEKKRRAAPIE
jgi:hypothetical protein